MLSIDQFVKMCADHIKFGLHFIAYHHPHGYMVLRTDMPYTAYKVEHHGPHIENKETKRKAAPKSLVNGMRREIARMRKDPRCQPLRVVEFDGNLSTEGGDLDELYTVPVPGGGTDEPENH